MRIISNDNRNQQYYLQKRVRGLVRNITIVRLFKITEERKAMFENENGNIITVQVPDDTMEIVEGVVYERWKDSGVELILDKVYNNSFSEL